VELDNKVHCCLGKVLKMTDGSQLIIRWFYRKLVKLGTVVLRNVPPTRAMINKSSCIPPSILAQIIDRKKKINLLTNGYIHIYLQISIFSKAHSIKVLYIQKLHFSSCSYSKLFTDRHHICIFCGGVASVIIMYFE